MYAAHLLWVYRSSGTAVRLCVAWALWFLVIFAATRCSLLPAGFFRIYICCVRFASFDCPFQVVLERSYQVHVRKIFTLSFIVSKPLDIPDYYSQNPIPSKQLLSNLHSPWRKTACTDMSLPRQQQSSSPSSSASASACTSTKCCPHAPGSSFPL